MTADPRGSIWRRWDPHIHTPGTLQEDEFGDDAWVPYLDRIEAAVPVVEVLGITDYCSLDNYEKVLEFKTEGRLPGVTLVFPNVELRLGIGTAAGSAINLHLLVSPEDPDHVAEAKRFLSKLQFKFNDDTYGCSNTDLVRLGRAHKPQITADSAALKEGSLQFKVGLENLKEAWNDSGWARENLLIAVAAGKGDGTSGLQTPNSGLAALRTEIERFAHVMFTGNPSDRRFWLGNGVKSKEAIRTSWGSLKPTIHGSDAHKLADVAAPALDRFTWIKGDATFESLRQACIEPGERAFVGVAPPDGPIPYRTIDSIRMSGAEWVQTPIIPLNRGLIAIVGARGSGKTALADLIAAGAYAVDPDVARESFLYRASRHLNGSQVELSWSEGPATVRSLPLQSTQDERPRVQYLSQQFVDRLCSADGMTSELLEEIERVVFEAHPIEERLGATNFADLLDGKAARGRATRNRAVGAIGELSAQIETERKSRDSLAALKARQIALVSTIAEDRKARSALIIIGGEERAKRLDEITTAVSASQQAVDLARRKLDALNLLGDAVQDYRNRQFPALQAQLRATHAQAGLDEDGWAEFLPSFGAGADDVIGTHKKSTSKALAMLVGKAHAKPNEPVEDLAAYIADGADLAGASLSDLKWEQWRLSNLIGVDKAKSERLAAIATRIAQAETALGKLNEEVITAEGADSRIADLSDRRREVYAAIFDGYADEELQLRELYEPVRAVLDGETGALGLLTFTVRRVVDAEKWADEGEKLFDLRKAGPFAGKGTLLRLANNQLLPAWQSGASEDVAEAMTAFREKHDKDIIASFSPEKRSGAEFWEWGTRVSNWLTSTDHISVSYGVQYDGVDIEQLSPGTRGIVLLLLYLAIDQTDDRPLIIDQPEENLDPQSIFRELVGRFQSTRARRQIIIVTHNANLVVNTDADQVIVASVGPHRPGALPEISYASGGLEDLDIRTQVCEILEGGAEAFRERARRLRVKLR